MANPRVSVVVAVYKAGKFLDETVASVLAQSWSDFELILVDDGPDFGAFDSRAWTAEPRIRIVRGTRQGAAAAVNVGIRAAVGEWIALLDHDDVWLPGKLLAHMECVAGSPAIDLTFDWSRWIDGDGADLGLTTQPWRGAISFEGLLEDFVIGTTSSIVVRRSAMERAGPMDPSLRLVYDTDFCLRIAAVRPGNCHAVPAYLTLYRRHAGQLSDGFRNLQKEWNVLLTMVPRYAPRPLSRQLAVADSNMRRYFAWLACEAGMPWSALRLALSAFRRAPSNALRDRRNWMMLAVAGGRLILPRRAWNAAIEMGKRRLR
jgi:glycosyltransferase involved in cell wall biosynthesis